MCARSKHALREYSEDWGRVEAAAAEKRRGGINNAGIKRLCALRGLSLSLSGVDYCLYSTVSSVTEPCITNGSIPRSQAPTYTQVTQLF